MSIGYCKRSVMLLRPFMMLMLSRIPEILHYTGCDASSLPPSMQVRCRSINSNGDCRSPWSLSTTVTTSPPLQPSTND